MANQHVQSILSSVQQKICTLLKPDRFYVVQYDPVLKSLRFPLVYEKDALLPEDQAPWTARGVQARKTIPDEVIAAKQSLAYEQDFKAQLKQARLAYWPSGPRPSSWLGVPLLSGGRELGALVVESWRGSQTFGENGRRVLEIAAQQTAAALQNALLYERLERKVEYLGVLNQIGQQITAGVGSSEQEILEKIYAQARRLPLDTDNMYIALYDAGQDKLTFSLVCEDGKRIDSRNNERWQSRTGLERRTGWIIRNRQPRLTRTYREGEAWYDTIGTAAAKRTRFASWIAAPMVFGDQAFGAVAAYHETEEYKYGDDDLEVLQILAGQAAVAIQNLRFHEAWVQEQEKVSAANRLAVMSDVASEFAHRMNNLAGTIPSWVELAKEKLELNQYHDEEVSGYLDDISQDAKQLLQAAQVIKKTTEVRTPEPVKINELVEIALGRAMATQPGAEKRVAVVKTLTGGLPEIQVERDKLLDTLTSVIKNGVEAMPEGGTLTLVTRLSRAAKAPIEILVTDTGIGIQPGDLTKIFDLFYTTKGPHGLGYGLWRDKAFIKELGGDIDVHSEVSKGTTFTIRIPTQEEPRAARPVRSEQE